MFFSRLNFLIIASFIFRFNETFMPYICQDYLPISPWMSKTTRRLPGVQPLRSDSCFIVDEVFQRQMAYRETLLKSKIDKVYFNNFETSSACDELLDFVVQELKKDSRYSFKKQKIVRPDGVEVDLLSADPLKVAACLVQEDLLLLKKENLEHILRAGVLCFPASWTLDEKKNKSLTRIHGPVKEYGPGLAPRIEKMFSNLKPETPIWRANFLLYDDYELFQPRLEQQEKGNTRKRLSQFMRVERQILKKLPISDTILFSIHTFVVPYQKLSQDQTETLSSVLV